MTHPAQGEPPHRPATARADGTDRHEELIQQVGGALLGVVPPGWRRIDLKAILASTVHDLRLIVIMPDGSGHGVEPPHHLDTVLAELRRLMYQPGLGTWFSVRFTMDPPSRYHVSYNFDHDPLWTPPVPPTVFMQDLTAFPRDEQHIPGWLRARLAEARTPERS